MGDGTDQHVIRYQTSFGQGYIGLWTRGARTRCNKSQSVNITFLQCVSHREITSKYSSRYRKSSRELDYSSSYLSIKWRRWIVKEIPLDWQCMSEIKSLDRWSNWLTAMYLHHLLHWPPNVSQPQDFPDRTNRDPWWELGTQMFKIVSMVPFSVRAWLQHSKKRRTSRNWGR